MRPKMPLKRPSYCNSSLHFRFHSDFIYHTMTSEAKQFHLKMWYLIERTGTIAETFELGHYFFHSLNRTKRLFSIQ